MFLDLLFYFILRCCICLDGLYQLAGQYVSSVCVSLPISHVSSYFSSYFLDVLYADTWCETAPLNNPSLPSMVPYLLESSVPYYCSKERGLADV